MPDKPAAPKVTERANTQTVPGKPAAPRVTERANTKSGLDVSWEAPSNAGPAIASYDLRYRTGSSGGWTGGPQDVSGLSTSIGGLRPGTSYQVQVRATNAAGDGAWSDPGEGTTTANSAPSFDAASYTFDLAENAAGNVTALSLGTVKATDADPGDVVSYSIQAGNTESKFELGTLSGVLTYVGSGENYEGLGTPASAFTLTVRASDGLSNTDVTVTVRVTDVAEVPGKPAAPRVTERANTKPGLDVSWDAPSNTGPAIASYDLRYRTGSSGGWTDGPQDVSGLSTSIGGLRPGTSYQVQVRASNAAGDGAWSESGEGRTRTDIGFDRRPVLEAWQARFGRTIAGQAVEAVIGRLDGTAGRKPALTLGGQSAAAGGWLEPALGADNKRNWREHDREAQTQTMTAREFLLGTSFHLSADQSETGGPGMVAWSRFASTAFEGEADGAAIDGTAATGFLGADAEWHRVLAGLMLSHSRGEGTYGGSKGRGKVESTLTGVHPYAKLDVSRRMSVWGLAGIGEGNLALKPDGRDAMETDVSLRMGALGVTGRLLDDKDSLALDVRSDAMWVGTGSEAAPGMAASQSEVTRLRLVLDGSRAFDVGDGVTLTPSADLGLRVDGGDAETGFGTEVGGGVAWSDPKRGLSAEVKARGLLTHEESGFSERGVSGGLTWDPQLSSERGPKLSLNQTLGPFDANGVDALLARDDLAGLAANDDESGRRRFEARLGYGVPAFGGHLTGTPEVAVGVSNTGRDYMLGWWLTSQWSGPQAFEFRVEGLRRESANDDGPPEHRIGFDLTARW